MVFTESLPDTNIFYLADPGQAVCFPTMFLHTQCEDLSTATFSVWTLGSL
jgi:hypothetical protein